MKQGENMEKQMQETVEETKEGVTADMLFSACIEEKLPAEMLAAFDVTECLSSKPDCETLLLKDKQTGYPLGYIFLRRGAVLSSDRKGEAHQGAGDTVGKGGSQMLRVCTGEEVPK